MFPNKEKRQIGFALVILSLAALLLPAALAATYEVVDDPTAPACGDSVCSSNESCNICQADCGACTTQEDTTGTTTGNDTGGTDTGGNSGGGGGSGVSARSLTFSSTVAGSASTISVIISHSIPIPQTFLVELVISKSGKPVHSDTILTTQLSSGRAVKIVFPKKWIPQEPGKYETQITLYSADKGITHFVEKKDLEISGLGSGAEQTGTQGYGEAGNDWNTPSLNPPQQGAPIDQIFQVDSSTAIIVAAVILAIIVGVVGTRVINNNNSI